MSTVLANTAPIAQYSQELPIKGVGLHLTTVGDIQMVRCCRYSASVTSATGESLNCQLEDVNAAGTSAKLKFSSAVSKPKGVIQFAMGAGTAKSKSGQICPASWTTVASIKSVTFAGLINHPKWGPLNFMQKIVGILHLLAEKDQKNSPFLQFFVGHFPSRRFFRLWLRFY